MYRVENVVIAAVSIVVLLVLKFSNVLFATAVSRFIFGCAVIAAIGLVFWMYFTDSGKAFVRNHNRKQQGEHPSLAVSINTQRLSRQVDGRI